MNALMLAAAVRLTGGRLRAGRIFAGAAAGSAAALVVRGLSLSRVVWLWLPCAMGMMAFACGRAALLRPLRHGAVLLCAAGLLGGTVLALQGATGSLLIAYALGGAAMLHLCAAGMRAQRAARYTCRARMTCSYRGRTAAFDAIIDSGNTLRDYLTHLPVIVIGQACAQKALALGDAPLRPIFADTAGGRQMMQMLAPQQIILETSEGCAEVRAMVALSPALGREAPALVPSALMDAIIKSRGG